MVTIDVDQEKCNACGACVTTCPVSVYELSKSGESEKSYPANADQCIVAEYAKVCPSNATKASNKQNPPDDISQSSFYFLLSRIITFSFR
jgi:ferredoxin